MTIMQNKIVHHTIIMITIYINQAKRAQNST